MIRMLGTDSVNELPFPRFGLSPADAVEPGTFGESALVKPAVSFMVSLPGASMPVSIAAALMVRNHVPAKMAVYPPFKTVSMR